ERMLKNARRRVFLARPSSASTCACTPSSGAKWSDAPSAGSCQPGSVSSTVKVGIWPLALLDPFDPLAPPAPVDAPADAPPAPLEVAPLGAPVPLVGLPPLGAVVPEEALSCSELPHAANAPATSAHATPDQHKRKAFMR